MVMRIKRDSFDEMMRKEAEKEYQDTATVSNIISSRDSITKENIKQEVILFTEIPCRLSFLNKESGVTTKGDNYDISSQTVKLFTSPEYEIPVGSRITVNHLGSVYKFECSSFPKTYTTHQEIEVRVVKNG